MNEQLTMNLESVEKKAWIDICKSALPETAEKLGQKFKTFSTAEASLIDKADTLALNRILGFESEMDLSVELLKEIILFYKSSNIPRFFLQIAPHLLNDDISARLNSLGFVFYNNWAKLYRDDSPVKDVESDVLVEQIGKTGARYFSDIIIKSFDWDKKLHPWFFDFVHRNNWIHYLAYYKNKPIGAAALFIEGEFGWLGFAATLKEFRKLGAQHSLINRRLIDGINNGCKHFIVETGENTPDKKSQSFLNLIDTGFELVYKRPNFIFKFQ